MNGISRLYGWISGQWRAQPMILGFSGIIALDYTFLMEESATKVITGGSVPAGEIWVLQHAMLYDLDSAITSLVISLRRSGYTSPIMSCSSPGINIACYWNGQITMEEGDYLVFTFAGAVVDDQLNAAFWAMRIDIDQ